MTKFNGGQNPLSYVGVRAVAPPDVIVATRGPTTSDRRYKIGTWWINKSADDAYVLTSVSNGSAIWLAAAAQTATDSEAQARTSTTVVVTPSNLAAEGFMQWADVSLSAAQIKALTTPFQLVAAQGAGTLIKFMGAVLKLNAGSEVLTEAGDNLGIKYTDASGVQVSQTIESTGFIDQAADTYTNAEPAIDAIVAASAGENAALVLDNLGSNYGGNASDDATLDVRVYYIVQSL